MHIFVSNLLVNVIKEQVGVRQYREGSLMSREGLESDST